MGDWDHRGVFEWLGGSFTVSRDCSVFGLVYLSVGDIEFAAHRKPSYYDTSIIRSSDKLGDVATLLAVLWRRVLVCVIISMIGKEKACYWESERKRRGVRTCVWLCACMNKVNAIISEEMNFCVLEYKMYYSDDFGLKYEKSSCIDVEFFEWMMA